MKNFLVTHMTTFLFLITKTEYFVINEIISNKRYQKKIFVAMLDNNQMYVSKTEMADKKFSISPADQKMTGEFYNSEK